MNNFEFNRNQKPWLVVALVDYLALILGIGLPLIAILVYNFLFIPLTDRFEPGGDLYFDAKAEEYNSQLQYFVRLKNIRSNFDKLQADTDYQKFAFGLPTEFESGTLYTLIEGVARVHGVEITSIDIADLSGRENMDAREASTPRSKLLGQTPPDVKKISLNLNVGQMTYGVFKNFMSELEKSVRLLDVTSFNFNPSGQGHVVSVIAYYFKE